MRIKLLFEIIAIFLFIGFTISVDNGAGFKDPDNLKQIKFIRDLNEFRRENAKKAGVTNMHELKFNPELAKNLPNCPAKTRCRFTYVHNSYEEGFKKLSESTTRYLTQTVDQKTKEIADGIKGGYVGPLEHLHPLQTDIGCAYYKDGYTLCSFLPGAAFRSFEEFKPPSNLTCNKGFKLIDSLCVRISDLPPEPSTAATTIIPTTSPTTEAPTPEPPTPEPPSPEPPTVTSSTAPEATPVAPDDQNSLETVTPKEDDSSNKLSPEPPTPSLPPDEKKKEPEPTPAKPTEMSEIDKKVKAYLESETDGDDYDEDDRTTTETSSVTSNQKVLVVFFVIFCVFLDSF